MTLLTALKHARDVAAVTLSDTPADSFGTQLLISEMLDKLCRLVHLADHLERSAPIVARLQAEKDEAAKRD